MKVSINRCLQICLLVITLFAYISDAHRSHGLVKLDRINAHQYLARFAVNKDSMFHAKARVRLRSPFQYPVNANIKILLMNDMEWDVALQSEEWGHRAGLARFQIPLRLDGSGEWTRWESAMINIKNRAQVWYILIADCEMQTHAAYPEMDFIKYEIELLNDGSQFSHEYWGQLPITFLAFLVFCYLLGQNSIRLYKEVSKNEEYETPLAVLLCAIFCEFLQLFFSLVHLIVYWYDGDGFWFGDYLSTIFSVLAQVCIISLILMLAYGWTITFNSLKEHDYFMIEIGGTVIAHIFLAALTIIDNGEHHKYHDFEGFQGLLLVLIRLGMFGFFLYKANETRKIVARKNLPFMKGFTVSASIYMLAFPWFYVLSYMLNPHMRLKFIVFGNLFVQMIALIILVNQVTKKGSKYYEASTRSQGILPNKFQ